MQYRKKPVIIDAWFMDRRSEKPDWLIKAISSGEVQDNEPYGLYLKTPEGVMKAHYGRDYIIKGIHGELYPCKNNIFEETYEPTNAHFSKERVKQWLSRWNRFRNRR